MKKHAATLTTILILIKCALPATADGGSGHRHDHDHADPASARPATQQIHHAGPWTAELLLDDTNATVTLAVTPTGSVGETATGLPRGPQTAILHPNDPDGFTDPIRLQLQPVSTTKTPTDQAVFIGRHEALLGSGPFSLTVTLTAPARGTGSTTNAPVSETVRFDVDPAAVVVSLICPHRCGNGRRYTAPGSCAACGQPLVPLDSAHGDHSPKHGGTLFMASDGFHHIEGALADGGEFRVYLYNDFTRPISGGHLLDGDDGGAVRARVYPVDEAGRPVGRAVALSFDAGARGEFLRAPLPARLSGPVAVELELRFPGRDSAERFSFEFE